MSKIWLESDYPDQLIQGIDEAGRGPLAGPCVVCGVILPSGFTHALINDSKQLSAKQRALALSVIFKVALHIDIVTVSPLEIDHLNIYQATKKAMAKIAARADVGMVFTDAMPLSVPNKTVLDFVKGDSRSINIAAASIVAKEVRDRIMERYDRDYPGYGFKRHKGYPTAIHIEALKRLGPCPIHRLTYGPVLQNLNLFDQELGV